MSETIPKKRIFHIAKELNISHNDIMQFLKEEGVAVTSLMAEVDAEIYDKILGEFSKEKKQIDRFRKEQSRKVAVDTRRKSDIKKVDKPEETKKTKPVSKKKEDKKPEILDKIKSETARIDKLKKEDVNKKVTEQEILDQVTVEDSEIAKEEVTLSKVEEKSKSTLKIIHRPTDEEKERIEKDKIQAKIDKKKRNKNKGKTGTKSEKKTTVDPQKTEKPIKPRKLKKINIASIADKISQTRKGGKSKETEEKKKSLKHPLPQFGKKTKKKTKRLDKDTKSNVVESKTSKDKIKVVEFTSVDELAQAMNVSANDVIRTCLGLGIMVTINQRLDMETIFLIADEFGFEVETDTNIEQEITHIEESEEDIEKATPRPPVVTIMGHVDHGKTSLLDSIRDANVVAGESGGITQHIGAYEVVLDSGNRITFLDTPGHAAFTAMRARGAQVTDIVVIIVAADDAVMPQTIEAIDHAKASGVPIIIAINKIDKPSADIDNVKRTLSERNVLVEDWGGKYQSAEISAKTGQGIDDLLEKILLEAEVLNLKANKDTLATGVVIESRLDKGLGPVATLLVKKGTLKKGDIFVCGTQHSKIRALMNERGLRLKEAFPSDPIQVLGFIEVPNAGDILNVFEDDREARKIATQRSQLKREAEQRRFRHLTLDQIGKQISEGQVQNLKIIIKGDVDGSIEALSDSLMELSTPEVAVNIVHRSVGMITETDVSLASASNGVILAFNVTASSEAKILSKTQNVEIRNYSIIYNAVNDVKLALEGLLKPEEIEEALGVAEVRAQFKVGRKDVIAGSYIISGKAIRNALLRIVRDDEVIHTGKLTTLKRFKDDVSEVKEGFECGISVEGFSDFEVEDKIEFYEIKQVKRTLE